MAKTKAQLMQEKLNTNKRKAYEVKKFPLDIENEGTGDIMLININVNEGSKYIGNRYTVVDDQPVVQQRNSTSLRKKLSNQTVRINSAIALPIPSNLTASYDADWSSTELGTIGSIADAFTGIGELTENNFASEIWKRIKQSGTDVATNTLAGTVQALSPLNVKDLKNLATSQISNPYAEVLFNGISNRTFSFTFKLIPKNAEEQQAIKAIVDELKFHRAPEVKFENQNNYWLFPSTFDIKFINKDKENPWLFKISTCAMTNFSVSPITENAWVSYADGSPFGTQITMQFTELEQLTKERIQEGF